MENIKKFNQTETRVSVILSKPNLLRDMVEDLALDRKAVEDYPVSSSEWRNIETSSLEAFAEGDVYITIDGKKAKPSFTAPYLFTCVRMKGSPYMLTWKNSMN